MSERMHQYTGVAGKDMKKGDRVVGRHSVDPNEPQTFYPAQSGDLVCWYRGTLVDDVKKGETATAEMPESIVRAGDSGTATFVPDWAVIKTGA